MSRTGIALASLGLTAALLGCTGAPKSAEVSGEQEAVVFGSPSGAEDDGVVYIYHQDSKTAEYVKCSGVVIAPNVILTALHCVTEGYDGTASFGCAIPSGELLSAGSNGSIGPLIDPTTTPLTIGSGTAGAKVAAHGAKLFGTGSTSNCQNDIAAVVTDTTLALPIYPVRFDRLTTVKELGRVIGYGVDENGMSSPRQFRADVAVTDVGTDGGADGGSPRMGSAAPKWIVTGEGPCHGDSGGPLVSEDTGAAMGIYSLNLTPGCVGDSTRNAYTQIAPFKSLIQQALDYAGQDPILEPPLPTAGTGGTGGISGTGGSDTGTGAAAGEAGALGEGGAALGTAGDGATAASGGSGGSGGSEASGATGGTGGTDSVGGTSAAGTGNAAATGGDAGSAAESTGSRSRRDPACTCRTVGTADSSETSVAAALLATLGLALRRRRRLVG